MENGLLPSDISLKTPEEYSTTLLLVLALPSSAAAGEWPSSPVQSLMFLKREYFFHPIPRFPTIRIT